MDGEPKYLTYVPWDGFLNNTRMCFEVALVMATIAKRVLVIPENYRRLNDPDTESDAGDYRPLHPRDFLDFEGLDRVHATIPHEEYLARRASPDGAIGFSCEPGTAVFCHPSLPPSGSADAAGLVAFACGRRHFVQLTPAMRECETLHVAPMLEHFYTFFHFLDPQDARACRRFIRDYAPLRPEIVDLGRGLAASLGVFNAVHIRRKDFVEQFPETALSAERILETLLGHFEPRVPLYIASDEPQPEFFRILRGYFRVYRVTDLVEVSTVPAEVLACTEQVICACAERFIGTRLSTFSAYITRLRGHFGAADQRILFTDGTWQPEWDDARDGRCSWDRWLRSGHPLWAREFREGWECGDT